MSAQIVNNKIIAKNTLLLYIRTAISMIITLYTSRVVLMALGVEDYGVRSAVGGMLAMGSVITGALANSISRYITYELGHGDFEKLKRIFTTAINIQLMIALTIFIIGETLGMWFLNTKMNIPDGRMIAANWVLQLTLLSFFVDLTQVPYSACIVGHEKMSVFAWFSIMDSILRLVIVYLLYISPFDKLISYCALGLTVSILMRMSQRIYCGRKFSECHYKLMFDRHLTKEMTGFAGWSFIVNTTWVFNNQGLTILINIFFGVAFNAARGIASTIEGIIKHFYSDFMTALSPQITKSYAAGQIDDMNHLICRGTRYSYYLMFVFSLPFMFEAYRVLYLWLGVVPDYTVIFFRLGVVASLVMVVGQTGLTACMATGRIKWYTIIIGIVSSFVFPLTWVAFKLGAPVEFAYIIYIVVYFIIDIIRLFIMRHLWNFPIILFLREAMMPVAKVTLLAIVIPLALYNYIPDSLIKSAIVFCVAFMSACCSVYYVGLTNGEKTFMMTKLKTIISKVF